MKILLCDDHALFREGLRHVLQPLDSELVCLEASAAEQASELVAQHPDLDLVLMDLNLGGTNLVGIDGLQAIARLRRDHPLIPLVVVSQREELATLRAAMDLGVVGFIPKSATGPVLRAALQLVLSGGTYVPAFALGIAAVQPPACDVQKLRPRYGKLSERQAEVARLVARGLTNSEIARVLGLREPTVKTHLAAVFAALDVRNRSEVGLALRELGID
jgi:DNA-binding NarL/FixJ family response regulator